jgi:hypothetical protein
VLGDTKVSYGNETKLPGMGISSRASLLVYKWDYLSRRDARKLAREDEYVPTMQGIPIYVSSPLRPRAVSSFPKVFLLKWMNTKRGRPLVNK